MGASPDGTIPAAAAGVTVTGRQVFGTYFAGIVGIKTMTVSTDAAAAAGYVSDICSAAAGCALAPIAVPSTSVTCDSHGNLVASATPWSTGGQIVQIPLRASGSGNVGWIDWHPPSGGTAELANSVAAPDNTAIGLPGWFLVGATGNSNSGQIETALRAYRDKLLTVPLADGSCDVDPGVAAGGTANPCPAGSNTGRGQRISYLLSSYTGFRLCGPATPGCVSGAFGDVSQGAYISSNPPQCTAGHNTSCLFGRFEEIVTTGGLGSSNNPSTRAVGIQLTR